MTALLVIGIIIGYLAIGCTLTAILYKKRIIGMMDLRDGGAVLLIFYWPLVLIVVTTLLIGSVINKGLVWLIKKMTGEK